MPDGVSQGQQVATGLKREIETQAGKNMSGAMGGNISAKALPTLTNNTLNNINSFFHTLPDLRAKNASFQVLDFSQVDNDFVSDFKSHLFTLEQSNHTDMFLTIKEKAKAFIVLALDNLSSQMTGLQKQAEQVTQASQAVRDKIGDVEHIISTLLSHDMKHQEGIIAVNSGLMQLREKITELNGLKETAESELSVYSMAVSQLKEKTQQFLTMSKTVNDPVLTGQFEAMSQAVASAFEAPEFTTNTSSVMHFSREIAGFTKRINAFEQQTIPEIEASFRQAVETYKATLLAPVQTLDAAKQTGQAILEDAKQKLATVKDFAFPMPEATCFSEPGAITTDSIAFPGAEESMRFVNTSVVSGVGSMAAFPEHVITKVNRACQSATTVLSQAEEIQAVLSQPDVASALAVVASVKNKAQALQAIDDSELARLLDQAIDLPQDLTQISGQATEVLADKATTEPLNQFVISLQQGLHSVATHIDEVRINSVEQSMQDAHRLMDSITGTLVSESQQVVVDISFDELSATIPQNLQTTYNQLTQAQITKDTTHTLVQGLRSLFSETEPRGSVQRLLPQLASNSSQLLSSAMADVDKQWERINDVSLLSQRDVVYQRFFTLQESLITRQEAYIENMLAQVSTQIQQEVADSSDLFDQVTTAMAHYHHAEKLLVANQVRIVMDQARSLCETGGGTGSSLMSVQSDWLSSFLQRVHTHQEKWAGALTTTLRDTEKQLMVFTREAITKNFAMLAEPKQQADEFYTQAVSALDKIHRQITSSEQETNALANMLKASQGQGIRFDFLQWSNKVSKIQESLIEASQSIQEDVFEKFREGSEILGKIEPLSNKIFDYLEQETLFLEAQEKAGFINDFIQWNTERQALVVGFGQVKSSLVEKTKVLFQQQVALVTAQKGMLENLPGLLDRKIEAFNGFKLNEFHFGAFDTFNQLPLNANKKAFEDTFSNITTAFDVLDKNIAFFHEYKEFLAGTIDETAINQAGTLKQFYSTVMPESGALVFAKDETQLAFHGLFSQAKAHMNEQTVQNNLDAVYSHYARLGTDMVQSITTKAQEFQMYADNLLIASGGSRENAQRALERLGKIGNSTKQYHWYDRLAQAREMLSEAEDLTHQAKLASDRAQSLFEAAKIFSQQITQIETVPQDKRPDIKALFQEVPDPKRFLEGLTKSQELIRAQAIIHNTLSHSNTWKDTLNFLTLQVGVLHILAPLALGYLLSVTLNTYHQKIKSPVDLDDSLEQEDKVDNHAADIRRVFFIGTLCVSYLGFVGYMALQETAGANCWSLPLAFGASILGYTLVNGKNIAANWQNPIDCLLETTPSEFVSAVLCCQR